jgi:hypothetical protein
VVPPDSHRISRVPHYLGTCQKGERILSLTGLSPSLASLSSTVLLGFTPSPHLDRIPVKTGPTTPPTQRTRAYTCRRFRLFPLRSPLLRESHSLSLPRGTEMFQFPRFALAGLCIQPGVTGHDPRRVSPFGNLRVTGCLHLTEAYRSLPRPSSPSDAKASTTCP